MYVHTDSAQQPLQFQILGHDAQLLQAWALPLPTSIPTMHAANPSRTTSHRPQVFLPPGASVRAEPGAMCFMSDSIAVDVALEGGVAGVFQHAFSGESVWSTTL